MRAVWLCRLSVLHYTSLTGHTETALALVEAGADVHCKSDKGGCSVLHLASWNGHTETAMALITTGADVNSKNNDGYGPRLHGGAVACFVRLRRRMFSILAADLLHCTWHPQVVARRLQTR